MTHVCLCPILIPIDRSRATVFLLDRDRRLFLELFTGRLKLARFAPRPPVFASTTGSARFRFRGPDLSTGMAPCEHIEAKVLPNEGGGDTERS